MVMVDQTTALIVSAVAGAGSAISQHQAARQQKKARRVQSRMADIEAQRQRQQQVREARIKRAQLAAGAQASGVENTSSLAGAQSGLQTELASNLSFINTTQKMGNQASGYLQRAENFKSIGSIFDAAQYQADKLYGNDTTQYDMTQAYKNIFKQG